MASAGSPAARLSRITDTMIRVPLMDGLPWHTFESTLIRSRQFIGLSSLVCPWSFPLIAMNKRQVTKDYSSFYQPFRSKLLPNLRPFVFAFAEFLPVALGLFPRHEFVEQGDVEADIIVEVGFKVQVRGPAQLVLEVAQFGG